MSYNLCIFLYSAAKIGLLVLFHIFGLAYAANADGTIVQPTLELATKNWRIYDAGVAAGLNQQPTWIDSDRLLISGIPLGNGKDAVESKLPMRHVYIWKLPGERRSYSIGKAFCYSRSTNFIRIYVGWSDALVDPNPPPGFGKDYKLRTYKVGEFGREELIVKKTYFKRPRTESKFLTLHNRFTCQLPDPPIYKPVLRVIGHLIPGHGHLDFGPADNTQITHNHPVILRRLDGTTVELPFGANVRWHQEPTVASGGYRFFEFKNAYFLWNGRGGTRLAAFWRRQGFLPAWWLWPDGRTEKTVIPSGPWADSGASHDEVLPTKAGYFISILGLPESNGAYLVKPDGKFVRIMPGWFMDSEVSPDGCKVASVYADYELGLNWKHLRNKVIDFCVDGDGKQD